MAVVFLARDARLKRRVALKVLTPEMTSDDAVRQRFIQESRAAAAVDDPHIIPVYEAGEAGGALYIAMRYVAGGDARHLLARERQLSPGQAAAIVSAVASALDSAHAEGLVHRDVKPANILLDTRPGRPDHVYLSDFGLSKGALAAANLTRSGMFVGTPDYTAPEQIHGHPVTGQADQYGLACTAFELLSGEPVFVRDLGMAIIYAHVSEPPPSLRARRPDLPASVDAVLGRALAKAPQDRFGSCQEFAGALRRSLSLATGPAAHRPATVPAPVLAAPAPAVPAPVPASPAPAAPAEDRPAPAAPVSAARLPAGPAPGTPAPASPAGTAPPPAAAAGTAPPPAAAAPIPSPVTEPGWVVPVARASGATAEYTQPPGPGLDSRTDSFRVPGGAARPAPVPQPPGRAISRRALLVTGAAAVPVAAGAGVGLWVALRPSRGPRWQTRAPGGQAAVLAAAGDLVVAAGGPAAHALSARTGRPEWSARTADGTVAGLAVTSSVVYLALDPAAASPFLALRATSGSQLWTAPFTSRHGLVTTAGFVYVGTDDFFALRSGNGSPLWDIVTQLKSNVVTQAGALYMLAARSGSPARLQAVNSADGTWRWKVPGPETGVLATDGRVVCATEGPGSGDPGQLWAWRASDGSRLWLGGSQTYGPPAVGAGAVYAVSQDRRLTAFHAVSGHRLWSHPADPRITPVVSGAVVYAGAPSGGLLALRAGDGTLLWSAGHAFTAGPVVAGGSVYVSNGSTVSAFTA